MRNTFSLRQNDFFQDTEEAEVDFSNVYSQHVMESNVDHSIERRFSPNLPNVGFHDKLEEQSAINYLMTKLNTPSGSAPQACKIYDAGMYKEVVVFDPWRFKTYSFKAELMLDVTMRYPSSLSGYWWGRVGWTETEREADLEERRHNLRRRLLCGQQHLYLDVLASLVYFAFLM